MVRLTHDELAAAMPENGVLIQKKYVAELNRWLSDGDIELSFTAKRVFIRTTDGSECLSLPRAAYTYPDYTAFLARLENPEASTLKISRKDALDALDRLAIFNTENDRCTSFGLSQYELTLTAQGQDTGSASELLEVSYDGTLPRIVFPTRSMMDIFTHYASDDLSLTLTGAEGPCGIKGESDPGYTVLLMPMKVAQQDYYSEEA
jgi:DNA polymerase-3 subunit beta